ncbi:MAG: choice-of-anchor tandem repeat GloVer-containing protein [Candidatus Korobacteraceae bacterium]|jgi:uncharacterized repeat protein (TIGR03803 family)
MACIVFAFCTATAIVSLAQTLTTLHSFDNTDGANPFAGLVQASDGNFYGTTYSGGASNEGVVFKITPSGVLTTLHSFCQLSGCTDGTLPAGGLVQGTDGNLYGTTAGGGANNRGTVFKITLSGTLTTLYSFCNLESCADGALPYAGLVQAANGNFYGTTEFGGQYTYGAIFQITPSGTLTTLYSFCADENPCPDGARSTASLIQAADGKFYGTTQAGGANHNNDCAVEGCGTVFEFTVAGGLTTLYSFCAQNGCTDGQTPNAGLVQATNGNFYGTTSEGGANNNNGTVFKITATGTLTTLYSFCSRSGCTDGQGPAAGLIQATGGNLYGTTTAGGKGGGTIFAITPSGTLTTLYIFCQQVGCADGEEPQANLIQSTNGNFYGTTFIGGTHGYGAVFSLSPVQFVPLTPCRVVDTRNPDGPFGGPAIPGNTARAFPLSESDNPCGIPSTAIAYSLNVTVVPEHTLGYLTIWPTGENQPVVSTMNSPDGRVKANAAIVPAGMPSGSVSVYVTDTTNVILDIDGYFAARDGSTLAFYTLPPCRIVDTRNGQDQGSLQAGVERDYTIPPNCNVPSSAVAYSFNVTVVPTYGALDYLTVWPQGETRPTVSTLNNHTGTTVANAAIVPAGNNNTTAFYAHNNKTDLLLDINGYFAAPGGANALSLYPVAPCRVLNTRQNNGQPFSGTLVVNVVGSVCAPSSSAEAYVFNATVVPPGRMPYLTLWPDQMPQQPPPTVSTLNADDGFITSNMAIVPTTNGSIDAYAYALTQLILDISGYFAP